MTLNPVPMTYRGVRFRSTLEADWAATLDELGISWQYEPQAVQLPSGELYRCDFYLPQITTWLEVKGPLGERLHKTRELAEAVVHAPGCTSEKTGDRCACGWWDPWQLVIIGEAPTCGEITFRLGNDDDDDEAADLGRCGQCGSWFFFGSNRSFRCRAFSAHEGDHHLAYASPPQFAKAPRKHP